MVHRAGAQADRCLPLTSALLFALQKPQPITLARILSETAPHQPQSAEGSALMS